VNFLIREMKLDDIKQVQEVAKQSWYSTYEGIIPLEIQDGFLKSAYSDEMMKKRLEQTTLLVLEIEGEIVGFANFFRLKEAGEVELGAIYIIPEYQGKGFGTLLLNEGIKRLKDVKKIFVNVEKENKIGMNFYNAKGFQITSEFDDDFGGHILKTVRMKLNL